MLVAMISMTKALSYNILLSACLFALMSNIVMAGYIGIEFHEQNPKEPPYKGIKIIYVSEGSAADLAGMQVNDVILALGDDAVTTTSNLSARFIELSVGQPVHVRFWREGETREVVLIAGEQTKSAKLYQQARELGINQKYQEALELTNRAVALTPDATSPHFLRAWLFSRLKQHQAVIDEANHILSKHKLAVAYIYRADAYQLLKDFDRAISDYDQAIRQKPDQAQYYNSRGFCYAEKGNLDRAFFEYTRAIEVDPGFSYGYKNRADILRERGDIEKAKQEYHIAAKMFIKEALKYKKDGNLATAIQRYTSAINLNTPYSPSAHYNRGLTYEEMQDYPRAIQDYTKAILLNPGSSEAYLRRGFVYAQIIKDYERAESDWSKAVSLDPRGQNGQMARKNLKALEKIRPVATDEYEEW